MIKKIIWGKRHRKNKYNARKMETGGRIFHSEKEGLYAQNLEWRKRAGEITSYQCQVPIVLKVKGVKICEYIADFLVTYPDGKRQYIDVKGFSTEVFKLKWKLCMALKDEIDKEAEWIVVK